MFHHYPSMWDVIADSKFFYRFNKLSKINLLLLKASYNFFFCFCYSFLFHLVFDPIFNASLVKSAFQKFDDFITSIFKINDEEENKPEVLRISEENEKLIKDNFEMTGDFDANININVNENIENENLNNDDKNNE